MLLYYILSCLNKDDLLSQNLQNVKQCCYFLFHFKILLLKATKIKIAQRNWFEKSGEIIG